MKLRRTLLFLLAGLVLGELLYVGAFEWAARSGRLARWLSARPDKFRMEFASAHSYFPFRVSIEKLDLAVQSTRVQWHLTADTVDGWIAPVPLLARRFRVEQAAATGVEFALRRRFDATGKPLPASEFLPSIGEFSAPMKPQRTGTPWKPLWNFEFPRLAVSEVRGLWLEQLRVEGDMKAAGGFSIRRRREAEVEEGRIEIRRGVLTLAGQPLAGAVEGNVGISSAPYEYREHRGLASLPFFDATAKLEGSAFAGALLSRYLSRMPWIEFDDGPIPFHSDLRMRRGTLVAGSSLFTDKAAHAIRFFGFEARGIAELHFDVHREAAGDRAEFALRYDKFELRRRREGPAVIAGSGLSLVASTLDLRPAGLPDDGKVRLDLGKAHIVDLAGFSDLIPTSAGLALAGGKGKVQGGLDIDQNSAQGELQARLTDVALISNGVRFTGGLELELPMKSRDLPRRHFDLSGAKLELTGFLPSVAAGSDGADGSDGSDGSDASDVPERLKLAAEEARAPAPGWWATVTLSPTSLRLVDPATAAGQFTVRMRDSIPLVQLYATRKDLPGWVERLLVEPDVEARGEYSYTRPELLITNFKARFEHWGFEADLELGKKLRRGLLLLEWRKLAVGVQMEGTDKTFKLTGAREWFEQQKL